MLRAQANLNALKHTNLLKKLILQIKQQNNQCAVKEEKRFKTAEHEYRLCLWLFINQIQM
jgi:hypothetical protein